MGQNLKKSVQVSVSHCHSIPDWNLHIYLAVSFYTKVNLCNIWKLDLSCKFFCDCLSSANSTVTACHPGVCSCKHHHLSVYHVACNLFKHRTSGLILLSEETINKDLGANSCFTNTQMHVFGKMSACNMEK